MTRNVLQVLTVDELTQHENHCKIDLKCRVCMVKFSKASNLKTHVKKFHEDAKIRIFKCDDCAKTFNSHYNLQRHHLTVHQKLKSYKCETCGKNFGEKQALNNHNISVHEDLKK